MTTYIEPSKGLLEKIIKRIHKEERLLGLKRTAIFSTTLIISVIGFFPAFSMLSTDLNQTGFLQFLSLTFSDWSIVATYWQTFIMILLETMPAVSLALFLAVLLTFLQSIKSLSKNVKIIVNISRFATN